MPPHFGPKGICPTLFKRSFLDAASFTASLLEPSTTVLGRASVTSQIPALQARTGDMVNLHDWTQSVLSVIVWMQHPAFTMQQAASLDERLV